MNETTSHDDLTHTAPIDDLVSSSSGMAAHTSGTGGEPAENSASAPTSPPPLAEDDPLRDFVSSRPIADQIVFQMFLDQYPETGWDVLSNLFQDMLAERGIEGAPSPEAPGETVGIYGTFGFQYMAAVQTATFLKVVASLPDTPEGVKGSNVDLGTTVMKAASTTMSYSHWMADTVQNMSRKVNSFWTETDDTGKGFMAAEAVLSGTQVFTNIMFLNALHVTRKQAEMTLEIRQFHQDIADNGTDVDYLGNTRDRFQTETNFPDLLKMHNRFLEHNQTYLDQHLSQNRQAFTQASSALETANTAIANATQALDTAGHSLTGALRLRTEIRDAIAADRVNFPDDWSNLSPEEVQARENAIAQGHLNANADFQGQNPANWQEAVNTHIDTVRMNAADAQEQLTAAQAQRTQAQTDQAHYDTEVRRFETATETVNKQTTWANGISTHLTQDPDLAGKSVSKWGIADNGISMLRGAAGLGFWSHEGSSAELHASFGLGIASDGLYTGQSTADFLGGNAKATAALGLFASTVGVASVAVGLADITRQLDNPDLTDDQRDALKQAAALQGTMMAAMAAEGALAATAMLSHSAKALSFATKGVPVAGAVVTLLSVLDPVSWQRFDAAKDYIDHLRETDDGTETNGLLADRLEDTYDKEVAHYAAATAVDAAFGIASIGIAATGVGAPVAVAVALVGAAISTIIRLTEGNTWQREADKLADEMRSLPNGDQQTIAQFFEKQLDTRWEAIAAENEERFDRILDKNFDSIIGLGSQSFTDADASLAIQSDTISEMGKTAKHYGTEYLGQGNWDHQSVTLDESAAQIDLPNGGADKAVYLTFMAPLMLAVEEVYTRPMFNFGKGGGTTTTYVSGWTITDGTTKYTESSQTDGGKPGFAIPLQRAEASQTSTTFDVTNVITDYVPLNPNRTVIKDLSLKINALGGDDTYLADQAKVVFNGGAGEDTASYLNIDDDRFARGIQATANGANQVHVEKHLAAGSEYLQEVIKTKREQAGTDMWGKAKYKTVEYRAIEVAQHAHETTVVDLLTNIEVLQASDLDDILDLRGNTTVQRIFGFDGDDQIYAGEKTKVVLAGDGDDHIVTGAQSEYIDGGAGSDVIEAGKTLATLLQKVAAGTASQDDAVFLFGGDDIDAVVFDGETMQALREQYAEQQVAAAFVEYQLGQLAALGVDVDLARAIFEDQILGTSGDDFSLALFKGIEHLVFDLADIKPPVDTGMNGAAFTHYAYDLTAPRAAEEPDGGPPLTLAAFLSDPNNAIEDWLLPIEGYAQPTAGRTETRTDDVSGSLAANALHHFVGQVYLEAGVTYEFQESADTWGAVYLRPAQAGDDIDRTQVLRETTPGTATSGSFTATEGGWYEYDYYARTADAAGTAALLIRDVDADTAFQTLNGQDDPSLRLGFTSPMLAGSNVADALLENHWHAQDFNTMIASVLQASHGLPFLTRNTSKEIYDDAGTTYTTTQPLLFPNLGKGGNTRQITTEHIRIDLADWAEQQQADRVEVNPGRILEEDIAARGLIRYQGEIWLQEGETYKFRETAEDKVLFTLEDGGTGGPVTLLQDDRADHHTEASFTATTSGWHDFDFYAWNEEGPGSAKLEIGIASERDDAGDPVAWQFQTLEGNMAMAAMLDASGLDSGTVLQGGHLGESFIGSAYDDLIYGMDGHDHIDGGGGSDAMSGGDGIDTFVFRAGSGHDLIMELHASDWEDNLIKIADDQVEHNRSGDDLILWFEGNTADSLTLLNYYGDGAQPDAGPLRQHLLFANGNRETLDIQSDTGADTVLFRSMLAARDDAFAHSDVIEAAIETETRKAQFLNGSYQQTLLGDIEDWLGLG
ncbi:hypothetical protein So717_35270 [Roseobacter cerasinus]|uniref:RTX pore-forming domain-containing protein n=1 Tax=Roseobacter cerasinus TaxID=2602289 RepID=A0A640VVZ5_9RHOB|nr:hypothetical protein [Roseobacter cerasinus]GFE51774.1 hypothetical protein So717_35270 [Roseobacter cerasinus]